LLPQASEVAYLDVHQGSHDHHDQGSHVHVHDHAPAASSSA
jgi:hypothetical protein